MFNKLRHLPSIPAVSPPPVNVTRHVLVVGGMHEGSPDAARARVEVLVRAPHGEVWAVINFKI